MQPINQIIADGVHLLSLPDDRFKTMQLSVALVMPLSEDTASAYALIPYLLRRGCADYPDYAALQRRLDTLYGASITASVGRIGESQTLYLNAYSIQDSLALQGESVAAECADLLCKMLFEPALSDGLFREDDVEQEKRCLIEAIESEINEKRLYARRRCEELLCADEPYAVSRLGRADRVAALSRQDLTDAWKEILATAQIQIIIQGGDGEAVAAAFRKGLGGIDRRPVQKAAVIRKAARTVPLCETEEMDINQSKLVMGFRQTSDDDVVAARLMTALFGGTPHSLLFRNVRERLSLCYYCVSGLDYIKGLMMVDSGVALSKVDEAKAEILRQLQDVLEGRFTEDDLENAKRSIVSALESVDDSQDSRRAYYMVQTQLSHITTPEDMAAQMAAVTRERLMAAAEHTKLDGVYLLAEKGGAV